MQGLFAEVNQTVSVHTQTVLNDEIGPDDVIVSMQAITSMANKIECLKNRIKIVVAENVALREQENPPKRPMLLNWLFKPKARACPMKRHCRQKICWSSGQMTQLWPVALQGSTLHRATPPGPSICWRHS